MKLTKVLTSGVLGIASVAALVSCGGSKSTTLDNLSVCLASTPDKVDPALNSAVDGATYAVHLFSGLVKYADTNGDGELDLTADLATELAKPSVGSDGKATYTFTLRDGIKFSNGEDITAQDFVDSWNRAASYSIGGVTGLDADYGYMFEVIDGYDSLTESSKAGDEKTFLNVKATSTNTLTVTTTLEYNYFYELLAFPAYSVLYDAWNLDSDGAWAIKPSTCVTSGAYKMTKFTNAVEMVVEKRDDYWDADKVTTKKISFVFSDDDSAMLGQYEAGELAFIDTLSKATVTSYKNKDDYHVVGQLGTYYVSFNINASLFNGLTQAQAENLRKGISLLINRKYITETVTGLGETPSTGFVGAGLTDAAGGEFIDHNGDNEDGTGWTGDAENYASNVAKAIEYIKAAGYTYNESTHKFSGIPSIDYIINTNSGHQAIAEAIQAQLNEYGITVNISSSDWASFLQTRKQGNYSVARNGWLADYNDPISFLDMWVTSSGNNDCQLGRDAAASNTYSIDLSSIDGYQALSGTWSQTYDVLIGYIKSEDDAAKRYALMHKAETLLMSTGVIAPIYNYVDNWLQDPDLGNVYASPLGYKYFMWATLED